LGKKDELSTIVRGYTPVLSSEWERNPIYPPPRGAVLNAAGSDGEDG
jgi:hypothetical protein